MTVVSSDLRCERREPRPATPAAMPPVLIEPRTSDDPAALIKNIQVTENPHYTRRTLLGLGRMRCSPPLMSSTRLQGHSDRSPVPRCVAGCQRPFSQLSLSSFSNIPGRSLSNCALLLPASDLDHVFSCHLLAHNKQRRIIAHIRAESTGGPRSTMQSCAEPEQPLRRKEAMQSPGPAKGRRGQQGRAAPSATRVLQLSPGTWARGGLGWGACNDKDSVPSIRSASRLWVLCSVRGCSWAFVALFGENWKRNSSPRPFQKELWNKGFTDGRG